MNDKFRKLDLREWGHDEAGDRQQTQDHTGHVTGILSALSECGPNPFWAIRAKRAEITLITGQKAPAGQNTISVWHVCKKKKAG